MVKLNSHFGGWKKPKPEVTNKFAVKYSDSTVVTFLPSSVDLRTTLVMPPIYDQGPEGSCTANAGGAAVETDLIRQKLLDFMPARNFIYYVTRDSEGTTTTDSGASLADTVTAISKSGVCKETTWPYTTEDMFTKPSVAAYIEATQTKATVFKRVFNNISPSLMKLCLSEGNPFIFGFTVYASFESVQVANSGIVPMPQPNEAILGGHAVMCIGYDDKTEMFLCRNSWGTQWGQSGYFWIPYAYLTNPNLADDFWTIETVS